MSCQWACTWQNSSTLIYNDVKTHTSHIFSQLSIRPTFQSSQWPVGHTSHLIPCQLYTSHKVKIFSWKWKYFLGLHSYWRRFIQLCARMASPQHICPSRKPVSNGLQLTGSFLSEHEQFIADLQRPCIVIMILLVRTHLLCRQKLYKQQVQAHASFTERHVLPVSAVEWAAYKGCTMGF